MKRVDKYLFKIYNLNKSNTENALQKKVMPVYKSKIYLPKPEYNVEFLCNPSNRDLIAKHITKKKCTGNIDKVLELLKNSQSEEEFLKELSKIPNLINCKVLEYPDNKPFILKIGGKLPKYNFKPKEFSKLLTNLNLLVTKTLGPISGSKTYGLLGDLAELEHALVKYTIKELFKHNFQLISVPDILPSQVIERCGLINDGDRKLVYKLEPYYENDFSLSGTAEMALAYKLSNRMFYHAELPVKLAAVSRCYRAEISNLLDEKGIYRVHQFTKVEMFVSSQQKQSSKIMEEIVSIQEKLFTQLNLHFKILDMPPNELGAPACRKIDIEAWMPGRELFGEISSCSNCTDYQSRRLNIKYKNEDGTILHAHTLNGTACAIPRMLIAICETHQLSDGNIAVPEYLIPFMNGKKVIKNQKIALDKLKSYKDMVYAT